MQKIPYTITIELDVENLPIESEFIECLIKNNTLGTFLYTVANDICEGRYDLSEANNSILLNSIIDTVSTISETVSSMSSNITQMAESLNTHTELMKCLEEVQQILSSGGLVAATKENNEEKKENNEGLTPTVPVVNMVHLDLEEDMGDGEALSFDEDTADFFDF